MTTKKGTKDSKVGGVHQATQSHRILLDFALFRVIIMQRCLKHKTGQTPSLALIVGVTEGKTVVTPA
jgi:hypothetical protein